MKKVPAYVAQSGVLFLVAWGVAAATHYYLEGIIALARSFGNAIFPWLLAIVIVFIVRLCRGLKSDRSSTIAVWLIGLVLLAAFVLGETHALAHQP
jgi:hypothetical protein